MTIQDSSTLNNNPCCVFPKTGNEKCVLVFSIFATIIFALVATEVIKTNGGTIFPGANFGPAIEGGIPAATSGLILSIILGRMFFQSLRESTDCLFD